MVPEFSKEVWDAFFSGKSPSPAKGAGRARREANAGLLRRIKAEGLSKSDAGLVASVMKERMGCPVLQTSRIHGSAWEKSRIQARGAKLEPNDSGIGRTRDGRNLRKILKFEKLK